MFVKIVLIIEWLQNTFFVADKKKSLVFNESVKLKQVQILKPIV